jgi:rhamnulokinase
MAQTLNFCALDLGAESGRVMLGRFDGNRLTLTEEHRFASAPVRLPDGLHTDALRIWTELKAGIALGCRGDAVSGIGIDTWGVDFALLDRLGGLLANPYHYRDSLTDGILDKAFARVPRREIFSQTGLQFMPINTLYQLYALRLRSSPLLDTAERLLMTPDLFNYWLCGRMANEFTIATTSQCFNPLVGDWAWPLIEKFGLPARLFGPIVAPGTVLAPLRPELAGELGLARGIPVIAPGCHDTALAIAAVPASGPEFAYISCGTWSIIGAELDKPCITDESLAADFTNEGGVAGTFRFLRNLTGLWILQECRRDWSRSEEELTYSRLSEIAASSAGLVSFINPDDPGFAAPGNMPERVRAFCSKTGQLVPEGKGALVRCILESLALSYRRGLERLEGILGKRLDPIHLVGGGSRNRLLCAFAANATGRTVVAGPVEATAIGNVIMQAIALGKIGSIGEGRECVRGSFEVTTYEPHDVDAWEEAYSRFKNR